MLQKTIGAAALAWLLLAAAPVLAGGCPAHYMDGRLPEIRNPKLASATRESVSYTHLTLPTNREV